ncbi:MAG: AAA family ATPase, partial [Gammaproteobacteria bacterium]|nr:AAA family ATPase [Gammaproteobacteria bacterium]
RGANSSSGDISSRLQHRLGLVQELFAVEVYQPFAGRQSLYDTLLHLSQFGDMALVLEGEKGAGKTATLAAFLREARTHLDAILLDAQALMPLERLAQQLLSRLGGLRPDDSVEGAIGRFFSESVHWQEGRRTLIVIDNADEAPLPALKVLLSAFLASPDRTRTALPVFAGSPGLAASLQTGPVTELPGMHVLRLSSLSSDDVQVWLNRVIQDAGGGASVVDSAVAENVWRAGDSGNPGRIRRVATKVLLESLEREDRATVAQLKSSLTDTKSLFSSAILPVLALALLLAVLLWGWLSRSSESPREDVPVVPAPVNEELLQIRQMIRLDEVPEDALDIAEPEPEPASALLPDGELAPSLAASEEDDESVYVERSPPPLPPATAPAQKVAQVPVLKAPSTPASASSRSFVPASSAHYRDARWLSQRPGRYFTVQLLGSRKESDVVGLLRASPVDGLVYVQVTHQGSPWFVVLHGEFSSRALARRALDALPEGMRSSGPWIRDFAGLQRVAR